jgi:mono/diheme cytochrome c family protein
VKRRRGKHLRLVALACAALALACAGLGTGRVLAQQSTFVPVDPPKENPANTGKFAPLDWTPAKGEHPGKAKFQQVCASCHRIDEKGTAAGPGLLGLAERVPERERILKFVQDPQGVADPYFVKMRDGFAGAMAPRGGSSFTDAELLEIIDFILRHRQEFGPDPREKVRLGRALASGEHGFENGAPSCTGCHTIGAGMNSSHKQLRGANVGPNIAHTWVIARDAEGLKALLEDPKGTPMHHFYGPRAKPITADEYASLIAFFERAARDTGTEHQSNYLPIFALILAALGIFLLDGSLFGKLFVEEEHEYVDGPYADDHGHH